MLRGPKYDDPYIGSDEAYDSWKDEQGPDHVHQCVECEHVIRYCYDRWCKTRYNEETCEACRQKAEAVAAD